MSHSVVRKIVSAVLALLFAVTASAAFAAEIDLSSLTDDEIVALAEKVNEEIVSRKIEKTATLPKGTYYAGKDLPAGSYTYTCLATGNDWGNVTVYSGTDQQLWEVVSAPKDGKEPDTFRIQLNDGDELKSGVPFSLTISGGIFFK